MTAIECKDLWLSYGSASVIEGLSFSLESGKCLCIAGENGTGKSGLLVTEIQPVIRGVVVTCEGAADETVAALVGQAVCTALDITEKRVCVIPYNTERGS